MAVYELNMIFHMAAKKAGLTKKKNRKTAKKQRYGKWFNTECRNTSKELRQLSKQKTPLSPQHNNNNANANIVKLPKNKQTIKTTRGPSNPAGHSCHGNVMSLCQGAWL